MLTMPGSRLASILADTQCCPGKTSVKIASRGCCPPAPSSHSSRPSPPARGTGPVGERQCLGSKRRGHPKKEKSGTAGEAGWAPWLATQPIL